MFVVCGLLFGVCSLLRVVCCVLVVVGAWLVGCWFVGCCCCCCCGGGGGGWLVADVWVDTKENDLWLVELWLSVSNWFRLFIVSEMCLAKYQVQEYWHNMSMGLVRVLRCQEGDELLGGLWFCSIWSFSALEKQFSVFETEYELGDSDNLLQRYHWAHRSRWAQTHLLQLRSCARIPQQSCLQSVGIWMLTMMQMWMHQETTCCFVIFRKKRKTACWSKWLVVSSIWRFVAWKLPRWLQE